MARARGERVGLGLELSASGSLLAAVVQEVQRPTPSAGDALAEPYEDLLEDVRLSGHVNIDETGWRLQGRQRALWGAFTERHAVLRIAADRHEDHAKALLGPTQAIVTSDRWWAYGHLPVGRRQVCWSHYSDFWIIPTWL